MTFTDIANFQFIKALQKQGGEVFLVGGIVRDSFLGIESKDIDLVVRNLTIGEIMTTLKDFGTLTETTVADKMGILKFVPTGIDLDEAIDIALPRTERLMTAEEIAAENVTNAHNAFVVNSDPLLPIGMDLERRDFTINSMAINLADMSLIDIFGGVKDIENKVIRHTNDQAFSDDPLRMFRAVQFASRFSGFGIHLDTFHMIVDNAHKATTISGERVHTELMKIFNKGNIPQGISLLGTSKLHAALFPQVLMATKNVDDIKTLADFFHHICGTSANFRSVLKGDIKTAKGIDAINKANRTIFRESIKRLITEDKSVDMPQVRLDLFDAVKISSDVLDSAKLVGPLKDAQDQFNAGQFPKDMSQLAICGGDLKDMGIKPGPMIGAMLRTAVALVMAGTQNDKDTLTKAIMDA